MRLIFVRHAEAIEKTERIADDRRYLTPDGRFLFRKTAKTLRDENITPDLILSSPYLRAVQTADILAEKISYVGSLMAVEDLAPGFDMEALTRIILSFKTAKELVLVGHEPDLGMVISTLLSLPEGFSMAKGAALKVSADPDNLLSSASFKWMAVGRKLITSEKKLLS